MFSRQLPQAQMISSYSLRQRPPPPPPVCDGVPFELPHVDLLGAANQIVYKDTDDLMASTSDFVKRLYRMLEDRLYPHVIVWAPGGEAFVIKDVTEFTKNCLPRAFKHSNFASFVRQLNKYDFHKVKSSDAGVSGDQAWVFKHPQFRSGHPDGLEYIKRKAPAPRKPGVAPAASVSSTSGPSTGTASEATMDAGATERNASLQAQIDSLTSSQERMRTVIERLEANHQSTLRELVAMQRTVAQQDTLIQTLLQHLLVKQAASASFSLPTMPMLPPRMTGLENDFLSGMSFDNPPSNSSKSSDPSMSDSNPFGLPLPPLDYSPAEASIASMTPLSDSQVKVDPEADEVAALFDQLDSSGRKGCIEWSTTPRVLLVDDDAMSRSVSCRFLQDAGCTFDTAVDGMGAVDKMRTGKYDIVFMDVVMPNLDGVSATSRIRQFDPLTPIVSMTSNGQTSDIVSYMTNGMSDVLIKPFTKDTLVTMLEKHLPHLLGIPQKPASGPFTFTDADYAAMMQQFVTSPAAESGPAKRAREDSPATDFDAPSCKKFRY